MRNCRALDYPAGRLKIVWVTDGSNDRTNELLTGYPEVTVLFAPERRGKTAALNRGVPLVTTPLVVFTDANTMLGPEAIREIIRPFGDSKVGCVAGEKRVVQSREQAAASTEGIYWKYESKLKEWDDRLYTAVGAAGELFAIRRELFVAMPDDTLLDDFILSMRIAMQGLPDRLLQKCLRARRGLGRHDRRGQAQSAYRGRRAAIHRQACAAAQPIALRHTLVAIPLAPRTALVGDTDPAVRTRAAEYRAGRRRPAPDSLRYDPAATSGFLRLRTARLPPLTTQNQE